MVKSTTEDTEISKNGFAFLLPSIKLSALINEIKSKLKDKRRLLLVGESGTSKTTILMEILTDYFDEGYEILYNLEGAEIKNGQQLVRFIEKRLDRGDRILDNVHSERTSAIFYVMDVIISSYKYIQNIMFLLAALSLEHGFYMSFRLLRQLHKHVSSFS